MSTETCTVRPELIEFDKPNDSKFLSIVAHAEGFKFLDTATATNTEGNITNLPTDTANLASMFVNTVDTETMKVEDVNSVKTFTMLDATSVLEMSSGNMQNVGTFTTDHPSPVTISGDCINMNYASGTSDGKIENVGRVTFDSMSIANDSIVFGTNSGLFDMNNGTLDKVQIMNMTPNTGVFDVNSGVVDNVLTQNMFDNGVIAFPNGGELDMKGATCTANLGELAISTNEIVNRTAGASVLVESSVFQDENISTTNIKALGSEVNVVDATFGTDKMTVTNIDTTTITAIGGGDAGNIDLNLVAPGNGVINCGGSRISNVLQPVSESDVANKAYVTEAVANNIQGLKPKKACDYAIFGDQWTSKIFGTGATNYTLAANVAADELVFLTMSNDDLVFSGQAVTAGELNASYNAELDNLSPKVARKRILINGLRADGDIVTYVNSGTYTTTGYTTLDAGSEDVKGLNGIWEVKQYDNVSSPRKLILVRAEDMNENKEMMNNAYSYLNTVGNGYAGEAKKDFGYVVTNGDPIILDGLYTKMLTNPADYSSAMIIKELKWEIFNSVNYELDFIDSNNERREGALAVGAFAKGGLLMRSDPGLEGEKQIMVNANMLNYDVVDNLLTATGDVNLVSSNLGDDPSCTITAFANDGVAAATLFLNGAYVKSNVDGETQLHVDHVEATNVTCESDKTLKTNIEAMLDGLDLVGKFKPVTYQWIKDASNPNPEYGFIAQDVQKPFPTLVKENSDTGVLSVDYMKITSILVAAVQELSTEVKSLKAQLNA
jgi:hypothetical protein